jgi:hypothetical protein
VAVLRFRLPGRLLAGIIVGNAHLHDFGMLSFGSEPDLLLIFSAASADSFPPSAGGFFISGHR